MKTLIYKPVLFAFIIVLCETCLKGQVPTLGNQEKLVEALISKHLESESSSLIQNIKYYLMGASSKYSWEINYSSLNFQCTMVRPYDGNRSKSIVEISRTLRRDWRGQVYYKTLKNESAYTFDGKNIFSKETEDFTPFPVYPENYRYECNSSINHSTMINVITGLRVDISQTRPPVDGVIGSPNSGVSTFEMVVQADAKKVPETCMSNKDYEDWVASPNYRKSQKIVLNSTTTDPVFITKDFPLNLFQERVEGGVSVSLMIK